MALDCLATLVGLDDSDCDCYADDRPETWNTSESGYYVTELLPMRKNILANKDCADGSIWDLLIRARSKALRDIENDLIVAMSEMKRTPNAWRGTIGKIEVKQTITNPSTTHGVQFRTRHGKRLKDMSFIVKAIWVNLGITGTVDITHSSTIPDFVSDTITVNSVSGRFTRNELETPISLALYDIFQDCVYHNFTYEGEGLTPAVNRTYCCSKPGWTNHLEVCGISTNDFEDDNKYTGSYMQGLAFEGYFACDNLQWVCELDELNAINVKNQLARAKQYASAVNALNDMLKSDRVNFFTLMETESAFRSRSKYQKAYNESIDSIVKNIPAGFSSCFGCDKSSPQIGYLIT